MRTRSLVLSVFCLLASGCGDGSSSTPPATPATYGPPGPYGAPYGAPSQYPPPSYPYGQPPAPNAYGPPQNPYAPPAPYAPPQVSNVPTPSLPTGPDPITTINMPWLRQHASSLMQELISVLPDVAKVRVQALPILFDDTPGDVNAAAACTKNGAVMIVTDGLLDVSAHLSSARANDDLFHTSKVNDYIQYVAQRQTPNGPLVEPPSGFFDPNQEADPRRVARQHDVFDELLGFVLGHELGHHHLGHLPCTGGSGPLGLGEVVRGITSSAPVFNQPNEFEADAAGTNNVLVAGSRRAGYHLTEGGALLLMLFFSASDQLSPEDILFGFNRTHPPPALRIPVIQQTANLWRINGGWLPLPRF